MYPSMIANINQNIDICELLNFFKGISNNEIIRLLATKSSPTMYVYLPTSFMSVISINFMFSMEVDNFWRNRWTLK